MSQAIEGRKRPSFAKLQKQVHARHPVGVFAVNQMADDIECAPGVFAFILVRPGFRQIAEKRAESGGSASEKGDGVRQFVFHGAPRFAHGRFSRESRLYLFWVAGVTERPRRLYGGWPLKCGRYE